jgi:hypothetical protein
VSRIRNATDGLLLFRTALRAFNERHKPRIEQIRRKFSDNPLGKPPADFEDLLEAHVRKYLIDALLGALNWNIVLQEDPEATNLIPEAPIVSVTHATTRYLDYFGMEHGTGQALLIVESKRLGTSLPERKKSTPTRKIGVSSRDMAEIILGGLKGDELLHNWDEWLKTLKDYFVTVRDRGQSAPRRVVITDGIGASFSLNQKSRC